MLQQFHWTGGEINLSGRGDSDWAGDRQNMKSTSGGVIMRSGQCIKAWSTSQYALALSPGEAEPYAMTKVAVQLTGVISMARDFGVSLTGVVNSDCNQHSSQRRLGRTVPTCQSKTKDGELEFRRVLGTNNAMTKTVDRSDELHVDARSRGRRISRSIVSSASS